jgi:endonuclease/exonuclease/phosphatase family metal-dependent hydrolase
MKLASYNVENLFLRPAAMALPTWAEGREVLANHAALNRILGKPKYSAADKKKIVELLKALDLAKSDENKFVILRQNHGHLVKRPKTGGLEVVADGRDDWVGWLELKLAQVDDLAVENTARVIRDVGADVLGLIEAESRPALTRFSKEMLPRVNGKSYDHIMLIDGNDDRGIDVGIMLRKGYELTAIRSHVDDADDDGIIFSRDCAEYEIKTASKKSLVVLLNHFKSKGFGSQPASNAKRLRQAKRTAAIYKALLASGQKNVAVLGDFNDTPASDPLKPLLTNTNLKDITEHTNFVSDGREGTFGNGTASNKIDYVLLSPSLFALVEGGGIFRKGCWGGANGTLFPHYDEMTKAIHAASDHAAIWAEIDL